MTKVVTVQSQQMWEYLTITRKTADYLIAELNEVGKVGWELVGASYHKDAKTSLGEAFCWTAILKRPFVEQPPPQEEQLATQEIFEVAPSEPEPAATDTVSPFDSQSSIFDLQPPEDDPDEDVRAE